MNFEFMIRSLFLSMKVIWVFWSLICMITYRLIFLLQISGLVRTTRSIFLAMGRGALWWVRSYGARSQWQKGIRHVCIVAIEDKKMEFISYCMSLSLYIMSSFLMRYSVLYELNTLDACWIAVDVWSNSSRCRQESVYLSRTWCLYTWSCLDNLITMRFSIYCSTVICSPTVILMLSWEKPLVKPMAPGSIFCHIGFHLLLFAYFTFQSIS